MEPFEVKILGCGSALPTPKHLCACQIVTLRNKVYMVDCGEGAQYQMRASHSSFQRLGHIFLSHLHGDHWFGLIGLLSSFALLGRTASLHIYAHVQLQSTLNHLLQNYCSDLPYEITFHAIETTQHTLIHEDSTMQVFTIPLDHGVPCCGFLFREKGTGLHINRRAIDTYGIPTWAINNIKAGQDWHTDDGTLIPNEHLTLPPSPTRSYAYCSDTSYDPRICQYIQGVNLLYHEATYASDMVTRAKLYHHSTAREAAQIAKESKVSQLIIGHFSQRYLDETILLKEAQEIFPETTLAKEMMTISIK